MSVIGCILLNFLDHALSLTPVLSLSLGHRPDSAV
jgi:hypothetical protein